MQEFILVETGTYWEKVIISAETLEDAIENYQTGNYAPGEVIILDSEQSAGDVREYDN